jgi:hypothetical protein
MIGIGSRPDPPIDPPIRGPIAPGDHGSPAPCIPPCISAPIPLAPSPGGMPGEAMAAGRMAAGIGE